MGEVGMHPQARFMDSSPSESAIITASILPRKVTKWKDWTPEDIGSDGTIFDNPTLTRLVVPGDQIKISDWVCMYMRPSDLNS